ncbi:MAG TPA: branched-chain amino acid ABC transporter permease [Methylomirabilota bacterium]|nr:branched-chain amino acid ABC transporter permease [Methylomirabilota bacterium]
MRRAALVAGLVVAIAYPVAVQMTGYTYFQTVGFLVLIYATLGIGWNFIGGWAGQFDFGPHIFLATGAYTAALAAVHWSWSPWLGMAAGIVVSMVICALITFPVTRLRGHYFAIATVAMWMIAQPIGATWELINGSRGLFIPLTPATSSWEAIWTLGWGGRSKAFAYYYVALGLFAAAMVLAYRVDRSKLGYYFRAIRDDQEGAEAIGIDSRVYKTLARCLTAAVFAAGGVIYGFWALAVFPDQVLEMNWAVLPMISTVLGGIGRLWGPLLGAFILIPISQVMSATLGTGPLAGRGLDVIVYGIIIMAVAAFRPNGLLSLPWARWFGRG